MADAVTNLDLELDQLLTRDKWREYLLDVLESEKHFKCEHCGRNNKFRLPNVRGLIDLLDRAKGKPAESRTVEVIQRGSVLHELSDSALQALARGDAVIEEGEWTELQPLALPTGES